MGLNLGDIFITLTFIVNSVWKGIIGMLKKAMSVKLSTIILILIFAIVISGTTGYYNGKNTSADNLDSSTFYATILTADANSFHVDGLDINDINTRNEFILVVSSETQLLWRDTEMDMSEFKSGQTVAITYSGEIAEIYPAQIEGVIKIQLLDDKK